jgi:hypothetical protein
MAQHTLPDQPKDLPQDLSQDFPRDLVQAQHDWYATYWQLARDYATDTTELRRRLQSLSVRIAAHPFWATVPGDEPAARMRLKALSWAPPTA